MAILLGVNRVPLVLSGSRRAPDAEALSSARNISRNYEGWQSVIATEMFEHYSPYAEAVAAGEAEPPQGWWPNIGAASEIWPHTSVEYVLVAPLDGKLTVEIGYRVAWDDEHTLGARFREGRFRELCGSVLVP